MRLNAKRGQLLIELLPADDRDNKFNLTLVDNRKHYEFPRKGIVRSVGLSVYDVRVGDTVVIRGDAGSSFDYDENGVNDGVGWRRIYASEILGVLEPIAMGNGD